jgi:hypothetical protein
MIRTQQFADAVRVSWPQRGARPAASSRAWATARSAPPPQRPPPDLPAATGADDVAEVIVLRFRRLHRGCKRARWPEAGPAPPAAQPLAAPLASRPPPGARPPGGVGGWRGGGGDGDG